MFALTPDERRGLLVVALLFALGAGWDLVQARRARDVAARALAPAARLVAPADSAPRAPIEPAAPERLATAAVSAPLDLNRADAAELDALPGIGPVLAARIVDHRARHGRFRRVDELLAVPGIGPKLLARLRPLVAAPE
jgi:competence protein ComEA